MDGRIEAGGRGGERGFGESSGDQDSIQRKGNLPDDSVRHEEYFLYSHFRLLTEKPGKMWQCTEKE